MHRTATSAPENDTRIRTTVFISQLNYPKCNNGKKKKVMKIHFILSPKKIPTPKFNIFSVVIIFSFIDKVNAKQDNELYALFILSSYRINIT